MAYGQQVAKRIQETSINVNSTQWTALQGATPLARRFMSKVYNRSDRKVFISYDNTASVRARGALGESEGTVEPNDVTLPLYGRCAAGTARVIVTEYSDS